MMENTSLLEIIMMASQIIYFEEYLTFYSLKTLKTTDPDTVDLRISLSRESHDVCHSCDYLANFGWQTVGLQLLFV